MPIAAPTLYTFSYILIVLGALMVLVAVVGCCGAVVGSRLFLAVYGVAVLVLLTATLSCGIYIVYKARMVPASVMLPMSIGCVR